MRRFFAYLPEAVLSVARNTTRSLLSILGMVIGIASVIGVLGLSQAASNGIKTQLSSGGDPGYVALVDQSQNDPSIAALSYRDAALLQAYSGGAIARAIPVYQGRPNRVTVSGKSEYISLSSTDAMPASGVKIEAGRLINGADIASAANVCVLSKEAAEKLFPGTDPVDRTIDVGSSRLLIVGVFSVTGSLLTSAVGETIDVPYTAMRRFVPGPIDYLQLWPADPSMSGGRFIRTVKADLARIHPRAQYTVQDQAATLGVFENVLSAIGIGLTLIGGIALFVAGVGIMNIMLVSVTERTREIGIRKSIGANAGDIALQFLIEATLLAAAGGFLGTLLGIAIVAAGSGAIANIVGAAPVPWAPVIGVALVFSLAVGIGFGYYPAARAGRLDPVEALRS